MPRTSAHRIAALVVATAVPLLAQTPRTGLAVRSDTLPNGLAVIVVENHAVPVFKAYRGSGLGDTFAAHVDALGGSFNGATDDETVSYTLWLPSRAVGDGLSRLASLVRDPDLRASDLQTERFVVRNEMSRGASQPTTSFRQAMAEGLWGAWYPRKNTIGTDGALFAATIPSLREFYQHWYVPNNAALVVVGDVDPERVFGWARSNFGRWKRAADPFAAKPVPAPPALDSIVAFVFTKDVANVEVEVRWRGPTAVADDAGAASLVATLFDDDASAARHVLVHADGPFEAYRFSYAGHRHSGEFVFRGTTSIAQLPRALDMLALELDRLVDSTSYDTLAIAAAARRAQVDEALLREESPSVAAVIGDAWATGGLEAVTRAAAPVTGRITGYSASRLAAGVRRWITGRPFVAGVLVRHADAPSAADQLGRFVGGLRTAGAEAR